jgi:preprotein translocase subunit SecG
MKKALILVQIVLSVMLAAVILMQSRGAGLGKTFGGGGVQYHSKRGMEKLLFRATIVLAVLFFATSLVVLVV